MLNVKRLSDLLAANVDPRLYPRMLIMSPNGTLLAYSTPTNIKKLRDQAALISMAWKEHELNASPALDGQDNTALHAPQSPLETLTIEFDSNNLIVRAIQPTLLLVLVGSAPPGRNQFFKITAEFQGDSRYPAEETGVRGDRRNGVIDQPPSPQASDQGPDPAGSPLSLSASSNNDSTKSQKTKDMKLGILHIQRKKLDAMTHFILDDFERKSFIMPDDVGFS